MTMLANLAIIAHTTTPRNFALERIGERGCAPLNHQLRSVQSGGFSFSFLMAKAVAVAPPWGSKGLLNRAGDKIRRGEDLTWEELRAFEDWRAAHSYVLNTFKPLLWRRVLGKHVVVAQRLKRRSTIIDKLSREPKMELARMDDIAGCRLIFDDISSLQSFRDKFHDSGFNHKLRHEVDKYNYVDVPKASGYRGVHEIYVYNVNSEQGKAFNGLYVEMQYRTLCSACMGDRRRGRKPSY